ncbi:MAG: trypsin-like peptidase domain-containing protein, partial [Pseudomonadota bacterium]
MSSTDTNTKQTSYEGAFKKRFRTLILGTAALAIAGAGVATGTLPLSGSAVAEPVRVEGERNLGFAEVVERVTPAVVSVRVRSEVATNTFTYNGENPFENIPGFRDLPEDHPFNRFFRRFAQPEGGQNAPQRRRFATGQGSGFFISEDGLVVTNNHVIDKGTEFTIIDDDGNTYDADLIGADPRTDLALLKVNSNKTFTYVDFTDDETRVGEWVVAIGNPFGLGGTVTAGIVSARGRDIGAGPYDDFLQIDAAVNKGNSGGPAF